MDIEESVLPCDLVIFGVTGDLSRRKLLPALYHLEESGLLHPGTRVLGLSRSAFEHGAFLESVRHCLEHFIGDSLDGSVLEKLFSRLHYRRLDFADAGQYPVFGDFLRDSGRPVIFYLAIPAALYAQVCEGLHGAGLIAPESRIVLEKPIGDSLDSSRHINDVVARYFTEAQTYRIDHYLGKETVLNLLVLRFANSLFTTNWDHSCIDHFQITVAESVGIEDRWGFYDHTGQLRDMVQNHLLQILCLLAMEPPVELDAESIRSEKLKVLKALRPITSENVTKLVVRGQYTDGFIKGDAVPGYLNEDGAQPGSRTETFVAVKLAIDNWRWSGVPFYLRTGKRLHRKQSEISIHFKPQPHNIFRDTYAELPSNILTIRLQPNEGIELQMVNKVQGITEISKIQKHRLDLSFCEKTDRIVDAYERLLLAVIAGNQSFFVRRDEVEEAWRWTDNIIKAWEKSGDGPDPYPAGSWGPTSSISLIARDHRHWDE